MRKIGKRTIIRNAIPTFFTAQQKEVLIGTLLGDACVRYGLKGKKVHDPAIIKNRNAHLSIGRMKEDLPYMEWQHSIFKDFCASPAHLVNSTARGKESKLISRALPIFTEVRKEWYPQGVKIVPRNFQLTPLLIAVWLCDDGCVLLTKNKKHKEPRFRLSFHTEGFALDEIKYLKSLLDTRYDENFRISNGRRGYAIIGCDAVARKVFADIDSVFPQSMARKALWRLPENQLSSKAPKQFEKSQKKRIEDTVNCVKKYIDSGVIFTAHDVCNELGLMANKNGIQEPHYQTFNKHMKPYLEAGLVTKNIVKKKIFYQKIKP